MTYAAHAQAILALLDADNDPPPLVFFDGYVPDKTAPPYVVVYFAIDSPAAEMDLGVSDLTAASRRVDCHVYCHSVGSTGSAARSVASRVRAALLDATPTVSGRTCFPIRHVENQPAVRDESTGVLVMDQVDVYRLSSVPA